MPTTVHPLKGLLTGILTGALALAVVGDPTTETADVIVRGDSVAAVAAAVAAHGGTVEFEIGLIDGVAAEVPVGLVDDLEADGRTTEVSPDAEVQLLSLTSTLTDTTTTVTEPVDTTLSTDTTAVIGSTVEKVTTGQTPRAAMNAIGAQAHMFDRYTGAGVDVAVIDSGVDTSRLPGVKVQAAVDLSMSKTSARDGYGHGTAMAGVLAGVAPQARIIDVKVADERGVADVSQVLAGLDWVVSNRSTNGRNIRVLSLSFGTDGTNTAATSPLAYAAEAAWRHGIVVAVSAGNHGDELGRLMTPAISPWVIAVGAVDTRGLDGSYNAIRAAQVPTWSAKGSSARTPDIVAPGRSILGGLAPSSAIALANPTAVIDGRLLGSGTSQATAFTAGVLAAMVQQRPDMTPDQAKHLLMTNSVPLDNASVSRAGAGAINLTSLYSNSTFNGRLKGGQKHTWSDGSGTLDGDRGRFVLEDGKGNRLTGQNTVVGPFNGSTWTRSTWTGSTWTGSTWTGSTWTGSTWTGSTWTGSTWTGSTWTGSTWTGSTWTGSTWTNVRWGE